MDRRPFFGRIKSWFKQEFTGRYIALLMAEVSQEDPGPFAKFFKTVIRAAGRDWPSGVLRLEPEYRFTVNGTDCRADLALYVDDMLVGLLEIKFADILRPEQDIK